MFAEFNARARRRLRVDLSDYTGKAPRKAQSFAPPQRTNIRMRKNDANVFANIHAGRGWNFVDQKKGRQIYINLSPIALWRPKNKEAKCNLAALMQSRMSVGDIRMQY